MSTLTNHTKCHDWLWPFRNDLMIGTRGHDWLWPVGKWPYNCLQLKVILIPFRNDQTKTWDERSWLIVTFWRKWSLNRLRLKITEIWPSEMTLVPLEKKRSYLSCHRGFYLSSSSSSCRVLRSYLLPSSLGTAACVTVFPSGRVHSTWLALLSIMRATEIRVPAINLWIFIHFFVQ